MLTKRITFCLLIIVGLVLLIYGLLFNTIEVAPKQQDLPTSTKAETAVIKEVTIGGLNRTPAGKIQQTYTGKAPQACPT